ncbi:MAG: DUF2807 domain-containing protein [Flavobacteriaceae bacterium]|nr:DUF2807 domain-containing protein [Flavobacteriaceae bacterium]
MKNLWLIFFLFSVSVFCQQKTIGEFTELIIKDGLHVTMIPGEINAISITGENEKGVTFTNKDGQLNITMKPLQSLKGIDVNIELFFSSEIKKIDVSRGAYLSVLDSLQTEELHIRSRKGAEIELNLFAKKANYTAKTGGKIIVRGEVEQQQIRISSGGKVDARHTLSKESIAQITFGGSCKVQATSLFDLTTRFGGVAIVHGAPLKTVHNKTIGGSILFSKAIEE